MPPGGVQQGVCLVRYVCVCVCVCVVRILARPVEATRYTLSILFSNEGIGEHVFRACCFGAWRRGWAAGEGDGLGGREGA